MFQLNQVLLHTSIDRKIVRVTCLSPTKNYSYCSSAFTHLELLIFDLQTAILPLGTINEQPYKTNKNIHLRTIHQNKRKSLKEHARIGLATRVTRTQEMRKTKLGLKRNGYRKIYMIIEQKNYELHLF